MRAHQAEFPVGTMCCAFRVSESGYYAWATRAPSGHARRDAALRVAIRASHARSDATYGAPRVHEDLAEVGERVGRERVARLMWADGLAGVSRRKGLPRTEQTTPEAPQAPDLVRREAMRYETPRPRCREALRPARERRDGGRTFRRGPRYRGA